MNMLRERPAFARPLPRENMARYFERACYARLCRALNPQTIRSVEEFAAERWNDGITDQLVRAAPPPATMAGPGWASDLVHAVTGDFVRSLAQISAAASLFALAPLVTLDRLGQIMIPRRIGVPDNNQAAWAADGAPTIVTQDQLEQVQLGPVRKLRAIIVTTRQLMESSAGEEVFATLLRENIAITLDATVFSALPAGPNPAGLLNGVAPTASTDNQLDDVTAIAKSISNVAAGLAFVGHSQQAISIRLHQFIGFGALLPTDLPLWGTIAVPVGTIIALDPKAVVSAFGIDAEVTVAKVASLHMEGATPQEIDGAAPVRSLWQTDSIAVTVRLPAAWALRVAGAVAWMQSVSW